MGYTALNVQRPIVVEALVSVHYFEYTSSYFFEGESHDFWEFVYVDKGEVEIHADERVHTLKKGEMIFHAPNEFHALRANGVVAPNLVVASFVARGEAMRRFARRIVSLGDAERSLLGNIVAEAQEAFASPLDDPTTQELARSQSAAFGAEQSIACHLELLLIALARKETASAPVQTTQIRQQSHAAFIEQMRTYFEAHLGEQLTLADVCRDNLVGRSYLQKVFRAQTGGGAMEFFGEMKITAAKRMMREGRHNFTEIAASLGYHSIHYFSRYFKKITGMTPSEYASSVKLIAAKTRAEK